MKTVQGRREQDDSGRESLIWPEKSEKDYGYRERGYDYDVPKQDKKPPPPEKRSPKES